MTASSKITILAENYAYKAPHAEWGFSVLVESNKKKYLFDVGYSGTCVLNNANFINVDLQDIDGIILSHGHFDHTGGLESVLSHVGPMRIYAHPEIFKERYSLKKEKLLYSGIKYSEKYLETSLAASFIYNQKITQISDNIYMSGEVPFSNSIETIPSHFKVKVNDEVRDDTFPDDNSLIIDTPKGVIIIFGCAHRGIVNIMSYVKNEMNRNIYAVVGGTHLHEASDEQLRYTIDFLQEENVQIIAPGHCTGIKQVFELMAVFKDKVVPAFCGEVITL